MEVGIYKINNRSFLKVGNDSIEVKDYRITSSMQSGTELVIVINCEDEIMEFSSSAMKRMSPQQNLTTMNDVPEHR